MKIESNFKEQLSVIPCRVSELPVSGVILRKNSASNGGALAGASSSRKNGATKEG